MTITNVMSSLRLLLTDWDGLILNPNYHRRGNEIVWHSSMDEMLPYVVTRLHLKEYLSRKNYSFMIQDGSIVQFRYAFQQDETTLASASLCYLKYTDEEESIFVESNDNEYDVRSSSGGSCYPSANEINPVPWIRFDYSPGTAEGFTHTACHMHSSLYRELRIPVTFVPTPRQFMLCIVNWFYPDEFDFKFPDIPGADETRIQEMNSLFFPLIAGRYPITHLAT